jgi:hypothetical protein
MAASPPVALNTHPTDVRLMAQSHFEGGFDDDAGFGLFGGWVEHNKLWPTPLFG